MNCLPVVIRLVIGSLAGMSFLGAAEVIPDVQPDIVAQAQIAHASAEHALLETRQRILSEQTAVLTQLQSAVAAANAARERLAAADQAVKSVNTEVATRRREQAQELTVIKQLTDRAVIAARLGEAHTTAVAGLPPLQRIAAAIAGVDARIVALPIRLGLHLGPESIVGRDGALATVPVLRLGEARAVALGDSNNSRGLLERAADGSSWLVTGPTLSADIVPVAGAATLIPVDATGTAAHAVGAVHRTFAEWIAAGRAFIWPIIAVFIIGVLIIFERIVALARRRVDPRRLVQIASRLAADDAAGARSLVENGSGPLDRVLRAGLAALGKPRETREAVVEQALMSETAQLSRGLPAIAVLAGVAPLLGLLGTVTGMIDMFSVIAAAGSGNSKSLSGGISEALICTQAGMLAAIPLLLAHAWLGRLADTRSQLLEEAACGVLGLSEHGDGVQGMHPVPAVLG